MAKFGYCHNMHIHAPFDTLSLKIDATVLVVANLKNPLTKKTNRVNNFTYTGVKTPR